MQLAVVYFPKGGTEKLEEFRKEYDPAFSVIPAHITLVSPFPETLETGVVEYLDSITKSMKSFSIHVGGLMKSFDNYLFLLIKAGKEELTTLHNTLYTGMLAEYKDKTIPFLPHITLGYFGEENKFNESLYEKAYKQAEQMHIDQYLLFDEIALIKGDGISPAEIVTTFHLG